MKCFTLYLAHGVHREILSDCADVQSGLSLLDGCTCQLVPFAYVVLLNVNFVSMHILVSLFCCFTSQVNSFGHGWTVSSPYHTFFWASLNKWLHVTSMVDHRYHTKFLAADIFD